MKKQIILIFMLTGILISLSAEEEVIVDFSSMMEANSFNTDSWKVSSGPVYFPWVWEEHLMNERPLKPGLDLTAFKVPSEDRFLVGEYTMRVKGIVNIKQPRALIRYSGQSGKEGTGELSDVGPLHSFSVLLKNSGAPLELILLIEDDLGNTLAVFLGAVEADNLWHEIVYNNPEYDIIRRFECIKLDTLRFTGFEICPIALQNEISRAQREDFNSTEEQRLANKRTWEKDPDSILTPIEQEVDLLLYNITIIHGTTTWEEEYLEDW